uniref:non-specific serine/threonine protein kinase n=1 Tax=Quercus lobata TaxID=97700 RepID=A0A7N2LS00_QUELO
MLTTSVVMYQKNGLVYSWNIRPSPRTTYQDQFHPTWEILLLLKYYLSFNRLEGNVPDLGGLAKLELMFLTSNLLTGSVPEWIKGSTYKIDISYNNFSENSAPASLCRDDLELLECLGESPYSQEIVFRSTISSYSLGSRIFDVYIQEKLALKDFNIENEAEGHDKAVIKNFAAVVTNKVLMIRFHWAGKGTTATPNRGIYGPLVSSISVESDFSPPVDGKIVVGAVVSVLLLIFMILGILWWKVCMGGRISREKELRGLELQTGFFIATNNFNAANKIGEGGFGSIYKISDSYLSIIEFKQLSSKSKQGSCEFVTEIGMVSSLQHPNLVKLFGCCIEREQLLLVYEYMENNSLARALFGPTGGRLKLDWSTR